MKQPKVELELPVEQIEQLLDQLTPAVKIRLVQRWERQDRLSRFRALLARIDRRLRRHPHLAREAMKEAASARRSFYARRAGH